VPQRGQGSIDGRLCPEAPTNSPRINLRLLRTRLSGTLQPGSTHDRHGYRFAKPYDKFPRNSSFSRRSEFIHGLLKRLCFLPHQPEYRQRTAPLRFATIVFISDSVPVPQGAHRWHKRWPDGSRKFLYYSVFRSPSLAARGQRPYPNSTTSVGGKMNANLYAPPVSKTRDPRTLPLLPLEEREALEISIKFVSRTWFTHIVMLSGPVSGAIRHYAVGLRKSVYFCGPLAGKSPTSWAVSPAGCLVAYRLALNFVCDSTTRHFLATLMCIPRCTGSPKSQNFALFCAIAYSTRKISDCRFGGGYACRSVASWL